MNKTMSICLLCVLSAVLLIFSAFFCIPEEVNLGSQVYTSPLYTLVKGNDIDKGFLSVYDITRPDDISDDSYSALIQDAVDVIRARLSEANCPDAIITYSNDNLTVRINGSDDAQTALSTVTINGLFNVTIPDEDDDDISITVLNNSHIKKCTSGYSSSEETYYVGITLTKAGTDIMQSLTENCTSTSTLTFTFLIDGETYTTMSASEPFVSDTIYFTAEDEASVNTLIYVLDNNPHSLTLTSVETQYIAPSYGDNAALLVGCVVLLMVVAIIVGLCIAYKLQGLSASIALLFNIMVVLFVMSIAPVTEFSTAGLFGIIIVAATFAITAKAIFDKSKESYPLVIETTADKKADIAMERGRTFNTPIILKSYLLMIACSIALWIFSVGAIRSLAVVLTYGFAISLLSALFAIRFLNVLMTHITSDPQKLGLYTKEVKKDE